VASVGFCSKSDFITFDQNWHHLYSNSAGGNDFSNDTQNTVIGSEPEICTKMLRNVCEKLAEKFSVTTISSSMVKIARQSMMLSQTILNWKQAQQNYEQGEKSNTYFLNLKITKRKRVA